MLQRFRKPCCVTAVLTPALACARAIGARHLKSILWNRKLASDQACFTKNFFVEVFIILNDVTAPRRCLKACTSLPGKNRTASPECELFHRHGVRAVQQ